MTEFKFSPEEFASLWIVLERINSFMHTPRNEAELDRFQCENYQHIQHLYYAVLTSKVDDTLIAAMSEADDGVPLEMPEEVRRLTELLIAWSQR